MIWFNGFPFLDNKEDHIFNVPVSHAMTNKPVFLPATNFPVKDVELLLEEKKFQGFPIVDNAENRTLIGFIGRTELQYAIARARRESLLSPDAKCRFVSPLRRSQLSMSNMASTTSLSPLAASPVSTSPTQREHSESDQLRPPRTFDDMPATAGIRSIDFSPYIDLAPLTVHPRLPLETVMEIFKKMGPRVILVEHRGRLTGLVTVKDCLKYQFKVEAQENPRDESAMEERGEKLWTVIRGIAEFVGMKVGLGKGKVRLGESHTMGAEGQSPRNPHDRLEREGSRQQEDREEQGVELQDR